MSRPKSAREVDIMVGYTQPRDQLVTLANWQDPPYDHCSLARSTMITPIGHLMVAG